MQQSRYCATIKAASPRLTAASFLVICGITLAIMFASTLSFPHVIFAEDSKPVSEDTKPKPKDGWDIADIVAKMIIGVAGVLVTFVIGWGIQTYNKREAEAKAAQQKREDALHQLETVRGFLPQLLSIDANIKWASLALIQTLGDDDLALKVSTWYVSQLHYVKDLDAIQNLMRGPDPIISELATQAYKKLFPKGPRPAAPHVEDGYDPLGTSDIISHTEALVFTDDTAEKYGPFLITRGHHRLSLPAEFRMGIYLITNEFFLEFVKARGYTTESFWTGTPRQARNKFRCQDGSSYGPSTWPSEKGCPDGKERHPVAGISYYEALAFCQWLQKKSPPEQSGWQWCLPTEDMWEFTARTKEGRSYPWGQTFETGYCNSAESGFGTTTDVKAFPKGITPEYKCYDMAGNVWEYVVASDAEDWSCVLRGGSFRNNQFEIRSYLRLYRVPRDHRPPDFGFRCAQVHDGA
jgi:formylglycine-generating enzyme required for sulfatase activity